MKRNKNPKCPDCQGNMIFFRELNYNAWSCEECGNMYPDDYFYVEEEHVFIQVSFP